MNEFLPVPSLLFFCFQFVMAIIHRLLPILPLLLVLRRSDYKSSSLFGSSSLFSASSSSSPVASVIINNQHRDSWDREYDYIIVGGGSAGSVLANRLSEDPYTRVLLLEAGGTENIITDIPLAYQSIQQTPMDWKYRTVPQKSACFGLKNKVNIYFISFFLFVDLFKA